MYLLKHVQLLKQTCKTPLVCKHELGIAILTRQLDRKHERLEPGAVNKECSVMKVNLKGRNRVPHGDEVKKSQ